MASVVSTLSPGLAKDYDKTKKYSKDAVVLYQNAYWKCNVDMSSAEDWTPGHWTKLEEPLARIEAGMSSLEAIKADETTPTVPSPSLPESCFPVTGSTYEADFSYDSVRVNEAYIPGGEQAYLLEGVDSGGNNTSIAFFSADGKFLEAYYDIVSGTLKFGGRSPTPRSWPSLNLFPTGGSVVRSGEFDFKIEDLDNRKVDESNAEVDNKISIYGDVHEYNRGYPVEIIADYDSALVTPTIRSADGRTIKTYKFPVPDYEHGQLVLNGTVVLRGDQFTNGNLAKFDAIGNLVDSGKAPSDIPSVDATLTNNGNNPVKSSGIWGAIWGALASLPFGFASLYDWCKSFFVHASAIAPKWDAGGTYRVGDVCVESEIPDSSGLLYRCKKAYTATSESNAPSNDTEHWEPIDVTTLIANKQDALSAAQLANIAAVPGKADAADLRYRIAEAVRTAKLPASAFPIEYTDSTATPTSRTITSADDVILAYGEQAPDAIIAHDKNNPDYAGSFGFATFNATTGEFDSKDAPITSLSFNGSATATLNFVYLVADRTVNRITLPSGTSETTIMFPARTPGYSRDFMVRLVIEGSDVPQISFVEPDGSDVAFDEDDDAWADIGQGVNILIFTDTSEPEEQEET